MKRRFCRILTGSYMRYAESQRFQIEIISESHSVADTKIIMQ